MQGAHHSWKEFYDYPPENLPFNTSPDKTLGAGEVSSFLSIPVKTNSRKTPNSAPSPLQNAIKQFMKPETKYQYPETDKDQKISYLNFEYALLPHLVRDSKSQKWNLDDYYFDPQQNEIPSLKDRVSFAHYPSPSQWYNINQLRIHAGAPERSVAGIEKLANYYAQLQYLEKKFPFETEDVNIVFAWYESWFPERQVLTRCIQYEKASVLYNVAAIYSQLGTSERLWTTDGLKNASVYFQKAAGVLTFVRDVLGSRFKVKLESSSDLHDSTLSAMVSLMLAQAAECYYEKAVHESKTSSLTSILAIYNSDLYDVAIRHARQSELTLRSKLPRKIINQLKAKYNLYIAIAQFHTGPSASSDRAVAERLARLGSGKMYIAASIGYAEEVGGVLLESTLRHAHNLAAAHLCLDAANDEKIHDTPFDPRLLTPLRRPPEALVNPIDLKAEVLSHAAKCPDVLHGLLSNSLQLALQELEEQSLKIANEGESKMQALIDHYKKPIPNLESLPENLEAKFMETRMNGQKLLMMFDKLHSDERAISNLDLVACMKKIGHYADENLSESVRILSVLMKTKLKSGAEVLELQNLQSAVNQLLEDQRHNLLKMEKSATNVATSNEFNALEWSKDAFVNLFPVITNNQSYALDLISKWGDISKSVAAENEALQDLVAKCTSCVKEFKILQSTSIFARDKHATEELISEKKTYLRQLGEKSEELSRKMEQTVRRIKATEGETEAIMKAVAEISTQQNSIESFMDTMIKAATFKKVLIEETGTMLSTRLKSAGVLSVCFGKLKENEDLSKCKTADPLVMKLVMGDNDALLEKNQIKENLNLKDLKLYLLDADILPLEKSNRDKYENFLQVVQQQSDPVLLGNLPHRRPLPIPEPLEKRSVSFNVKEEKSTGFFASVKDSIYQYVLGGKRNTPKVSYASDQNPFSSQSRKSSYNSSYELEEAFDALKSVPLTPTAKAAENDYFTAVMKENAALRSQLFRIRSDHSATESNKNLTEQKKSERKKSTDFDIQKNHDLKMWIQHQNMVNSPNTSSRSSSSGPHVDLVDKKIAKATVMAASIAAGVTAQLQHKTRRSLRKDSGKTAFSGNGVSSRLDRDDSGVKVYDSFPLQMSSELFSKKSGSFVKPNLFQMKQDNDRLAKALGLV